MKSNTLAIVLGILGVLFIVAAVLYLIGGILPTFTSTGVAGPHYKHAVLLGVLAVASFIAANFARPRVV